MQTLQIFQLIALVLVSLGMGVHFGTWLLEAPIKETKSGALFTEVHQGRDGVAARVMPIMGSTAILSVAACVCLARAVPGAFWLSLAGLLFLIGDMIVTLAGNVPINKEVQSWNAAAPPSNWPQFRDRWEKLHTLRTGLAVTGFMLFAASVALFKSI